MFPSLWDGWYCSDCSDSAIHECHTLVNDVRKKIHSLLESFHFELIDHDGINGPSFSLAFGIHTLYHVHARVVCHPQRSYESTREETLRPVSLLLPWDWTFLWSMDRRRQEWLGTAPLLHPWWEEVVFHRVLRLRSCDAVHTVLRVPFFSWLALPSGADVQSLWGATSGGWHLWLWRQYQRGVVRPMDAAWSLLPIYEEPQWQAEHCKKKTLYLLLLRCAHCLPVSVSHSLRSPTYLDRRPRQQWGVYWTFVTHSSHSSTHFSITHTPQLILWLALYSWSMSPLVFIPRCST